MNQLNKEYPNDVKIVFRHNPLGFHDKAKPAAIATMAAHEQGKFWEMHDKLFANQQKLGKDDFIQYAQELGLNMNKFKADLDSPAIAAYVDNDQKEAEKIGARGTPAFFVNGRFVAGAYPYESFKTTVDEELPAANAKVQSGVPIAKLYEAIVAAGKTEISQPKPRGGGGADDKTVYKVPADNAPFKGPKDAKVTIVEYSDFECPFCGRVVPTLDRIVKEFPQVKVVFKHNPLPFHPNAPLASQASWAAWKQNKFWPYHDKLFSNSKDLQRPTLERYAQELGLNMDRFKRDMDSPEAKKVVDDNKAEAANFNAGGTPHFFVNGKRLVGAQPFESFKSKIEEELKAADALAAKGIPAGRLYAELTKDGKTKADAAGGGGGDKGPPSEDEKKVHSVPVGAAPTKGPPNAPVTIVVFSDFECPFCGRINPTIEQAMKEYGGKVRVAFKHYPLPFHPNAPLASEASMAANEQGKFWPYHDKLFANRSALKRDDLERYAQELGLDMGRFKAALDSGKYKALLEADKGLAGQLGVTGTPASFINGRKLVGAVPFDNFKRIIDEELKKRG
jgi:protein-disulfide isomerase